MAKKFTFPLETLLAVRRRAADQCKQTLAEAVQALTTARDRQQRLTEQLDAAMDVARAAASGPQVDVRALSAQRYWIGHLQGGLLGASRTIAERQHNVHAERDRLAAAAREVRVVETLRDKALARYRRLQDKEEARFLDEVALRQHRRREAS